MKQVACKVLQLLFTSVNGLHASQEQLHGWTQQQRHSNPAQAAGAAAAAAPGSTSCHSMLHISSYQPVPAAAGSVPTVTAAAAGDEQRVCLRGCEAHVDRGLLTVIAASQPGLQVCCGLGRASGCMHVVGFLVRPWQQLNAWFRGCAPAVTWYLVLEPCQYYLHGILGFEQAAACLVQGVWAMSRKQPHVRLRLCWYSGAACHTSALQVQLRHASLALFLRSPCNPYTHAE